MTGRHVGHLDGDVAMVAQLLVVGVAQILIGFVDP